MFQDFLYINRLVNWKTYCRIYFIWKLFQKFLVSIFLIVILFIFF